MCSALIKAVVFDWAGTTVDYGSFAPVKGFIDGFRSIGVTITSEMARKPMGLLKIDHTRAIAARRLSVRCIIKPVQITLLTI